MSDWAADIRKLFQKINKDVLTAVFAVVAFYIVLSILGIGCPIKWVTGISCAGCGMTRAYLSLLHLDIKHAFIYHPLFWSVPFILLIIVLRMAGRVPTRTANYVKYLTAFLFLIVYVVRLLDPEDIIVVAKIQEGLIWKAIYTVREIFA
ncbi:MAG: DUF2752 domain-containing protein [Acetatifactor sp.]|nr:DUF2752 domain-containing protein [Acetatifactor sp.]